MGTPLDDAKVRLRALNLEAESVINLLNSPSSTSDSRTTVGDLVASELGGAITGELFGRRRIGRAIGLKLSKQTRANQRTQLTAASRSRSLSVVQQVEFELRNLKGQISERRRRSLLNALNRAKSATKPLTIAQAAIRVIGEIEALPSGPIAFAPTKAPGARSEVTADQALLRHLEQDLRVFISGQLSSIDANWWMRRIPPEVRQAAEHRLQQRERTWPWTPGVEATPIHYVDFSDYSKIIGFDQNWSGVFGRFFGDVEIIRSKLRELEPIRNDIAHSRTLSTEARTKLRLYAGELTRMMKEGPYGGTSAG
jgi:hypothetical protein